MKYESVKKLIDKNILDKLTEINILDLSEDLSNRISKFKSIIKKDYDIDYEPSILEKVEEVEQSRLRYNLYYIKHCDIRINDFKWMIKNRLKFSKYNNKQIFNLILLKEKLLIKSPSNDELANDKSIFKFGIGDYIQGYSGDWLEVVALATVDNEPRYVVKFDSGWMNIDEVRMASPVIIKGKLPEGGRFSFRMVTSIGKTREENDNSRLQVLLSNIRLSK